MTLLYYSTPERGAVWHRLFEEANEPILMGLEAVTDPAEVTHIACWIPPEHLSAYPNLRMVVSIGAGTDHIRGLPEGVRLIRTIAPSIETMVRDWTVMATLMLHRDMPVYLKQTKAGQWKSHDPLSTRCRRVGIMGMGRIGRLVAESLLFLGFPVTGWSRSGRPFAGGKVFGANELEAFLGCTDLLICLLPLTEETCGLLNDKVFVALPEGALLVHAGRGAQLDMEAMRRALDSGQLAAAMLDVTEPEPLPTDHWAWRNPRVIITPHVASETDAEEGGRYVLEVLRAERESRPIPGLIEPEKGY